MLEKENMKKRFCGVHRTGEVLNRRKEAETRVRRKEKRKPPYETPFSKRYAPRVR